MEEKANDPNMQLDQSEEAEDTLSFCDLPIHSSATATATAEWEEHLSKEKQSLSSSSNSSDDQDLFEFFREEWSNSTPYSVHQSIVFCGKLIPFKQPISLATTTQNNETHKQKPNKIRRIFRLNFKFFSRSRTNTNSVPLDKCGYKRVGNGSERCGFSIKRASIMSSPTKPRWQLKMFGLVRLPVEMELTDMRSRQRRQSRSELFRLSGGDEKVRRVKGLWGLIRALGCGVGRHHHHHHYTNTAV